MAAIPRALAPDRIMRSVWVVVDPRDAVTGERVAGRLAVTLLRVTAEPIAARSAVYCFMDLNLPAGKYTAVVDPLGDTASIYFPAQREFSLKVPVAGGATLERNPVTIELLPRPAYPFDGRRSLARGRLVRRSNGAAIGGAPIDLLRTGVPVLRRGLTDDRGDFVVALPEQPPTEGSTPATTKKTPIAFALEFSVPGRPPHRTAEQQVDEGRTLSLGTVMFPTL